MPSTTQLRHDIFDAASRADLLRRLKSLTAGTSARWGRMTAGQMVCHLSDSFRTALGERQVAPVKNLLLQTVVKWVAFRTPMPWPRNSKTHPTLDQTNGSGTPPTDFASDVAQLEQLIERFGAAEDRMAGVPNAFFGKMTRKDWGCWGYRHCDHHLRQFGA